MVPWLLSEKQRAAQRYKEARSWLSTFLCSTDLTDGEIEFDALCRDPLTLQMVGSAEARPMLRDAHLKIETEEG